MDGFVGVVECAVATCHVHVCCVLVCTVLEGQRCANGTSEEEERDSDGSTYNAIFAMLSGSVCIGI